MLDSNRGPQFYGILLSTIYLFTASFNLLPTLNFTVLEAGICMAAPVWGFFPVLAARDATEKVPKPTNGIDSPELKVS